MKRILVLVAALMIAAPWATAQASNYVSVILPVTNIFVPNGFDDNDETQVVLSGILPNLCYKLPKAHIMMRSGKINITLTAMQDVDPNTMCAEMAVPFIEVVSLGTLTDGQYDIVVNEKTRFEATADLTVVESLNSTIDDHIYANVENVNKFPGSRRIQLTGYNPSDCFVLDRIDYVSNGDDTWAIMPVMEQIRESCPRKMVPFTYEAEVPAGLPAEQVLLHVRVMNGKSVNTLFNNTWGE